MRKLELFLIFCLFLFCIMNPQFVIKEESEDKTVFVSKNIKDIGDFLKHQEYFENIDYKNPNEIIFLERNDVFLILFQYHLVW